MNHQGEAGAATNPLPGTFRTYDMRASGARMAGWPLPAEVDTALGGASAPGPRVALVHERFTDFAGSEMVVEQLAREWPGAPVLAPITRMESIPGPLRRQVRPGALTRFTTAGGAYAHLLPALPVAMRRLDTEGADVVVASHHAFATQVVHSTDVPVIAYVHSPARWVWDASMRRGEVGGRLGDAALGVFSAGFRPVDRRAAEKVHTMVANSRAVAGRILNWWGRESVVVHPPVDIARYQPDPDVAREDFFLMAGRLVPYKRPELAVAAAARAGVRLVVVGEGRARAECERIAGPDTQFLGRVDDATLLSLYRRCRALVMPGIEDFGIVPVEAQACGTPVIAAAEGGALDTVLDGETGELVDIADDGAEERWVDVLRRFQASDLDPATIRHHAESFSRARFRERMHAIVTAVAAG